ncbi:MAG: Gfo/Idh/MocA family oxidoreductase [Prolixibacteraceae bacterium]|jgi:predicted dehydrogenase|nr:Gfo/Idh/MocA family oxidoreductase [Prolixibacteraceae bacterium]MBT6765250.1 Gfo/Idh/MocA family oxidoreductase [Prolixibacteraceae bacterium]MBT6999388.1 Gfo/Idh/MocA family oxidoreductase [Prolixibacteraceae bacterium]MBT7395234.1 Gfo/Idh/MocA family oxidoreductase [Prolixibacteraceae bacterium]
MKKNANNQLNRRKFLGLSALGLTGLTVLPSWSINGLKIAPSDRVVLGYIGCGRQALSDFSGFSSVPGVQVVACCDVDSMKQVRFKKRVEAWQENAGLSPRCDTYEQYEELLERKDIDAVEVVTPDHWHALQSVHAMQAGKDVYVQKPLAFTIQEGLTMVRVARDNKMVVQVGSQQRSSGEFQKAIELVQTGKIGHIEKIYAKVGDPPKPLDLLEESIPGNLNFNLWLGPLNDSNIHYHPDLCPPISLDPEEREKLWGAWRWYLETGNGYTADWGAHMFDIAQAAIGMDGSGPAEIIPKGYNGQEYMTFKYLNGIEMSEQPYLDDHATAQGIKFIGTDGWIEVARGYLACSDPSLVPEDLAGRRPRIMTAEERRIRAEERAQRRLQSAQRPVQREGLSFEISSPHMQNFIDSVRSRKDPIAPVEVGCSTNTLCCLGNIATELGRPVKWNPATLSFGDDNEAASHRLNSYEYRKPYSLL